MASRPHNWTAGHPTGRPIMWGEKTKNCCPSPIRLQPTGTVPTMPDGQSTPVVSADVIILVTTAKYQLQLEKVRTFRISSSQDEPK